MRLNTLFYIAEPLKILSDNFDKTKINDKSIGVLVGNVVFRPQAITLAGIKDHGMMKDIFCPSGDEMTGVVIAIFTSSWFLPKM